MPNTNLTDAQKLTAFAKEVQEMRIAQSNYFASAAKFRKNQIARDELQIALSKSKNCEHRVDVLLQKIFNSQRQLFS